MRGRDQNAYFQPQLTSPVQLCWTVVKYAYLMSVLENSGENQNQNARFFVISHNDPASNPNCAIWGWQALFSADQDKMPTWVITKLQLFNLEEIRLTRLESCHSESACEHFHAFQHKLSRKWKWLQECYCFGPFPCLANTNCPGNGNDLKNGNDFRNANGETISSAVTQNKNAELARTQVVDADSKSEGHLKRL